MILRHLVDADAVELARFDLGDAAGKEWLNEVAEIVSGLVAWCDDPAAADEDREVVVAEDSGQIVAVAAHTCLISETGHVWTHNRYLMVVAVRGDRHRERVAQALVESVFVDLADRGVRTVEWLVHPANTASIGFSRTVFPEADETSPPEDQPYVRFVVRL